MTFSGPVPTHFYRQSAVIPWRLRSGRIQILMITNRKGKRWVIPKGVVEPELDPATSAAKEALEEAGIEGEVSLSALGSFSYPKWGGICDVEVFGMNVEVVHDKWDETFRERRWYSPKKAASLCRESDLATLIKRFAKHLAK